MHQGTRTSTSQESELKIIMPAHAFVELTKIRQWRPKEGKRICKFWVANNLQPTYLCFELYLPGLKRVDCRFQFSRFILYP